MLSSRVSKEFKEFIEFDPRKQKHFREGRMQLAGSQRKWFKGGSSFHLLVFRECFSVVLPIVLKGAPPMARRKDIGVPLSENIFLTLVIGLRC